MALTGRQLLLAVLQRTKGRDVAARCKVSTAAVSFWAAGTRVPRQSAREVLRREYRIPLVSWARLYRSARR